MELNEYQKKAMSTCMPSSNNFSYMMLNLVGEVGEFSSKVAKALRKGKVKIGDDLFKLKSNLKYDGFEDDEEMWVFDDELKKEAGDIMWQISGLCSVMGWKLEDVCQQNLDKLASRKQRNVIDGNGDNR